MQPQPRPANSTRQPAAAEVAAVAAHLAKLGEHLDEIGKPAEASVIHVAVRRLYRATRRRARPLP